MDMPKPTEAHRRLETLVGAWRGEEKMPPSRWAPQGNVSSGRSTARLALDGFAAIVDYEQENGGRITFRGHGVYTYDVNDGCYVLHWFDCMGGRPEEFRGTFDGETLTMMRSGPEGQFRLTWRYAGDRMTHTMEMAPDGKQWTTLMEGAYTRERR